MSKIQSSSTHVDFDSLLGSPADDVHRFVETQQFEGPLTFRVTPKYNHFTQFLNCLLLPCSFGLPLLCTPIALFRPDISNQHNSLKLEEDNIEYKSSHNDCCCHIATVHKSVPLEKVQDVELVENFLYTLFGLKQVNVQTAGYSGPESRAEVGALFLENPEQVRDALKAAVRAYRAKKDGQVTAPEPVSHMSRSTTASGGGVAQRLARLNQLVENGILSEADVSRVRGAVLVSPSDPTAAFVEALELVNAGHLDKEVLHEMRDHFVKQCN